VLNRKVYALILAGGVGSRVNVDLPKQFIKISGKTLLEYTIEAFESNELIDEIIIVTNPDWRFLVEQIVIRNCYRKVSKILNGGVTRRESSYVGVMAIENDEDFVLIHDAVRPFVNQRIITNIVKSLESYDAVDTAILSDDTIIKVDEKGFILEIPTRKFLRRGQTPQAFRVGLIKKAHLLASRDSNIEVTDDCSLILKYNLAPVYVLDGDRFNIKITFPEDIYLADKIFQIRSQDIALSEEEKLPDIKGKVIVVFGASRGIGKAVFDLAQSLGARTYGFSRSNGVDVRDFNSVLGVYDKVLKEEGKIDYVVNTAAILKTGALVSRDNEDIWNEVRTNFIGSVNIVKALLSKIDEGNVSILLFASSSYTRGRPFYSIYSATKAAVVNFMQGISEELRERGILVNVLNPERTASPMRLENFGPEAPESLLSPEYVAKVTMKVLNSNFTGQVFDVKKADFRN